MWEQETGQYEFESDQLEFPDEMTGETYDEFQGESPLDEMEEMELAVELLTVASEAELDLFLGGLIKKAGRVIKSPVGRALGGILKGVAKKALPIVGGAIGSFVAPGVGTAIGSSLGSAAGKLFGLELEGLSNEDREFEVARRYVRLASTAARHAAGAPRHLPPHQIARRAVIIAARRHAPGLIGAHHVTPPPMFVEPPVPWNGYAAWGTPADDSGPTQSGRWVRRGRTIIILGA
jgi:hypothetical protein